MFIHHLQDFFNQRPSDRIYLHFDKTLYYPGDIIWFTAYLRDSMDLIPSTQSHLLNVALFAPDGSKVEEIKIGDLDGLIRGDFELAKNALGGIYTIKASTNWQQNEQQTLLFERKIQVQTVVLPKLKLQLTFEKASYGLGEEVIAKFVAESLKNEVISHTKATAKITLNGKEKSWAIKTNAVGEATIKFNLPKQLAEKQLLLAVDINSKDAQESIAQHVPLLLQGLTMEFFPEGGNALKNIPHKIAFRALNATGQPTDCEGLIVDGDGNELCDFSSFHQGMGSFILTQKKGIQYFAKVLKPALPENERSFRLPNSNNKGTSLQLIEKEFSNLLFNIYSTEADTFYLVAHTRGKVQLLEELTLTANTSHEVFIPTLRFPIGVTQVTLMNSLKQPLCERLVFINQHKQLSIHIKTDKAFYQPRERVELMLDVKDEKGVPVATDLSLSVTDDNLLNMASDKQGHILSKLLLEPDLKSSVYEPNFYFEKENRKATEALDYLMLTQGWRRFKWKDILKGGQFNPKYLAERLDLSGQVLRLEDDGVHPDTDSLVEVVPENNYSVHNYISSIKKELSAKLDQNGFFSIQVPLNKKEQSVFETYLECIPTHLLKIKAIVQLVNRDGSRVFNYTISPQGSSNFTFSQNSLTNALFCPKLNPKGNALVLEGHIEGIDSKQLPQVQLECSSFSFFVGTLTDKAGNFSLKGLRFGTTVVPLNGFNLKLIPKTTEHTEKYAEFNQAISSYGTYDLAIDLRQETFYETLTQWMAEEKRRHQLRLSFFEHQRATGIGFAGSSPRVAAKMAMPKRPTQAMASLEQSLAKSISPDALANYIKTGKKPNSSAQKQAATTTLFSDQEASNETTTSLLDLPLKVGRRAQPLIIAKPENRIINKGYYYPVREYASPLYIENEKAAVREDFRSTIFWQGHIRTNAQGKAQVSFCNGDSITSFKAIAEGMTATGGIGRNEHLMYSAQALQLETQTPLSLLAGDLMDLPITIRNHYSKPRKATFSVKHSNQLKPLNAIPTELVLKPQEVLHFTIPFQVLEDSANEEQEVVLKLEAGNDFDGIAKSLSISERGFPMEEAKSSKHVNHLFLVDLKMPRLNTLKVGFKIIGHKIKELEDALRGIIREPYGCFEQTSASNYPNLMICGFLQGQDGENEKAREKIIEYIHKGYKRLLTFECDGGGFEVFGRSRPTTTLTAYALQQFHDFEKVAGLDIVSTKMMKRTSAYLISTITNQLDFQQENSRFYFPAVDQNIANAYCLYSLMYIQADVPNKVSNKILSEALQSNDPYELALACNARICAAAYQNPKQLKQLPTTKQLLDKLLTFQRKDGAWEGTKHSITHSQGRNLIIETTSLAILACLSVDNMPLESIELGMAFIFKNRNGAGLYGTTHATILALKAILTYSKVINPTTPAGQGSFRLLVNKNLFYESSFSSNKDQYVSIPSMGKYFKEGENTIEVQFDTKVAPRHTLDLSYYSVQPTLQPECTIHLHTNLPETCQVGDFVPLSIKVENQSDQVAAMPMAIIGIPGGLSLQAWQLKKLQEELKFDYYEITPTSLVLYFRNIQANSSKEIELNLKADIQGSYQAQASSAYLYYTNEFKYWEAGNQIQITDPKR